MSGDLAEIRNMVADIQKTSAATAEAMSWVKTGMADVSRRLEDHMSDDSKRIGKLEKSAGILGSWRSAVAAVLGAVLTAVADRFLGGHS